MGVRVITVSSPFLVIFSRVTHAGIGRSIRADINTPQLRWLKIVLANRIGLRPALKGLGIHYVHLLTYVR